MRHLDIRRYFGVLIVGLLCLSMVINVAMLVYTRRSLAALRERPVYCTPLGTSTPFGDVPPDGVFALAVNVDPHYYQDEHVKVNVRAELTSKIPGSKVLLLHRLKGSPGWQETPMREDDLLVYSASLVLGLTDSIEYRLAEKIGAEIFHATRPRFISTAEIVGTGDVSISYKKISGSSDITWYFTQTPVPQVENLQIKEIILKVDKTNPESFTLSQQNPDGTFSVTFKDEGFKSMEITVVYKDGETRKAVYTPWDNIQNPLIKR